MRAPASIAGEHSRRTRSSAAVSASPPPCTRIPAVDQRALEAGQVAVGVDVPDLGQLVVVDAPGAA